MWRILETLYERFRHGNAGRQIFQLPAGTSSRRSALREGQGYVELWARSLYLAQDRNWFQGFYPTVHAFTTFNFGATGGVSTTVAHAGSLENLKKIDSSHLDRVIQINELLCSPIPFRTGSVEIEVGLVATKEEDDLERLLNVMTSFSKLVSVPQLSTALDVAGKVKDGVEEFLGAAGNSLMTGFHGTFVGAADARPDEQQQQYVLCDRLLLAINAPAAQYEDGSLSFKNDRVLHDGKPLEGVDWMLLEIKTLKGRANPVDSLPAISGPLNQAITALSTATAPDTTAADLLYRGAIGAALTSQDLIQTDRDKAADEIKSRYVDAKARLSAKGSGPAVSDETRTLIANLDRGRLDDLLNV